MNDLRLLQRAVAVSSEPEPAADALLLASVRREIQAHQTVLATLRLQEVLIKARIGTRG